MSAGHENMNAGDKNTTPGDNELFDLLVDGELDEQRRRELLSGLDKRPGGWRKCALAFLEAQSFGQELSVLLSTEEKRLESSTHSPQVAASKKRTTPRRSWPNKQAATLMAMAASFLLALLIGVAVNDRTKGPGAGGPVASFDSIATVDVPSGAASPIVPVVDRRTNGPSSPVQMVILSTPGGGGRSIRLPAMQRERFDDKWLQDLPPAMPDNVLQALKRTGHQIEQNRRLIPLKMKDGRRLFVPVDQIDVHYVGDSAL
ncbi:MAG: hypothetical protein V3V75_09085 [Thermoguttaceae bacterium]